MNQPDSLWAQLDWDENGQPVSRQFGDVYFSKVNGMAESDYVFVKHNRLQERFSQLPANAVFTIAETGFGSGLNFLCAWRVWEQFAPPSARLHFVSVEKYPLQLDELHRALALWPELAASAHTLIENYPPVDIRGLHRIPLSKNIQLSLVFADAEAGLDSLLPIRHPGPRVAENNFGLSCFAHIGPVDAWFLDGFAPAKNPQMWQPGLFELMAGLSHPCTTFATFTAAGSVKRGLQQAGFDVKKVAGFGNKRDMLIGTRNSSMPRTGEGVKRRRPDFSWHLTEASHPPPDQIAVIGAGLAGCHTARALAQRGFKVTLIDQHGIAAGASGNAQGVLYTKLSGQPSPLADFNLHAFLFAERFYSNSGLFTSTGQQTGVLQLAASREQEAQLRSIAERFRLSPAFAQFQDAALASATAGVELAYGGLLMPRAGWFNPAALCRALVEHANIEVWAGRPVHDLLWNEGKWEMKDVQGQTFATYPCVVVACADSARRFTPCTFLQTKAIRGQVTHARATARSDRLRTVLTGAGYIAPAADGQHCLGASYDLHSTELTIKLQDQQMNLQNVAAMSPDLADLAAHTPEEEDAILGGAVERDAEGRTSAGRTSLRCTTPDYLPMVGPVPQSEAQLERFRSYRHNTKAVVDKLGCYWPGLLLNTGHGSKGLTYTPICAEVIACLVTGEPMPLTRDLLLHLHPSRFLIRDLARRRV